MSRAHWWDAALEELHAAFPAACWAPSRLIGDALVGTLDGRHVLVEKSDPSECSEDYAHAGWFEAEVVGVDDGDADDLRGLDPRSPARAVRAVLRRLAALPPEGTS